MSLTVDAPAVRTVVLLSKQPVIARNYSLAWVARSKLRVPFAAWHIKNVTLESATGDFPELWVTAPLTRNSLDPAGQ